MLNAGKNTRFVYEVHGIDDAEMNKINAIDKSVDREYIIARMKELFQHASIEYVGMKSATYEDNLMMIDSNLPEIYGDMIKTHFMLLGEKVADCETLTQIMAKCNNLNYRKTDIFIRKTISITLI